MSLEDTLANMSLYDAKKYFRRAQNVVFNYTEMEAKVREATNNEPWGASTTLMEQISQGTYNMREREEVLGMIFRRFTEKRANEWRQIYKALQLLDYLIRHGSERFIDDTRSSISLIRMLESFHYIDSQGRDQGINVRNRAKALAELLGDDEKIRSERKKARETAKKYKGVAGGSATETGQLNARAGFNSTRVRGISISAESDEEEEENGTLSVQSTAKPLSSNSPDLLASDDSTTAAVQKNAKGEEDDDDDDDFAEFQSAVPVVQMSTTQSGTSQQSPAVAVFPSVVPAIATESKKSDPFSSLFSSAVKASEAGSRIPSSNVALTSPESNVAETNQDDDDDDLFGEMTGAGAAEQQKPQDTQTKAGEIDLLTF